MQSCSEYIIVVQMGSLRIQQKANVLFIFLWVLWATLFDGKLCLVFAVGCLHARFLKVLHAAQAVKGFVSTDIGRTEYELKENTKDKMLRRYQ